MKNKWLQRNVHVIHPQSLRLQTLQGTWFRHQSLRKLQTKTIKGLQIHKLTLLHPGKQIPQTLPPGEKNYSVNLKLSKTPSPENEQESNKNKNKYLYKQSLPHMFGRFTDFILNVQPIILNHRIFLPSFNVINALKL